MDESIRLTYNAPSEGVFDLALLGTSFIGTSALFKDLAKMTGIDGEVEVRTTGITHSSVDVHNIILVTYTSLPFNSPRDLFEFLQVADPEMLRTARDFFNATLGVHRTLNDYYARYPMDATLLTYLVGKFFVNSFKWISKQKNQQTIRDSDLGEISQRQARKYRNYIRDGRFRRTLKPITDGDVSSVQITALTESEHSTATITEQDIEKYLPDDDRILPEYENGSVHRLSGTLVSLQSARGEIIKIQTNEIPHPYSLITAKPHDGQTTLDYTRFYRQEVVFTAEVVRSSMFKRPEFVIADIDIAQTQLL